MKDKTNKRKPSLSPAMVEDKATEKLKKRLQDLGLIVSAGNEPEDSQAEQKANRKALGRWENEGGAVLRKKKGVKR